MIEFINSVTTVALKSLLSARPSGMSGAAIGAALLAVGGGLLLGEYRSGKGAAAGPALAEVLQAALDKPSCPAPAPCPVPSPCSEPAAPGGSGAGAALGAAGAIALVGSAVVGAKAASRRRRPVGRPPRVAAPSPWGGGTVYDDAAPAPVARRRKAAAVR